jgi:hypothetical protein
MMEEEMSAGQKRGLGVISNVTAETDTAYEKFAKCEAEEQVYLDNLTKMISDHFPGSDWYQETCGIFSPSEMYTTELERVAGQNISFSITFHGILIFNSLLRLRKLNGRSAISKDDVNTSRRPLLLEDAVDNNFIFLEEGKVTLHPNSRINCKVDSPTIIFCSGSFAVQKM